MDMLRRFVEHPFIVTTGYVVMVLTAITDLSGLWFREPPLRMLWERAQQPDAIGVTSWVMAVGLRLVPVVIGVPSIVVARQIWRNRHHTWVQTTLDGVVWGRGSLGVMGPYCPVHGRPLCRL